MSIIERLKTLRPVLLSAVAANGGRNLRVFGSVARREEHESSDIDFLVALEPGRTLIDLARLELRLEALLGRPVDVVTEDSLREPVRSAALREAVLV
jgi:predicted nucleotidyltransferase